jgi:hypothetical protein
MPRWSAAVEGSADSQRAVSPESLKHDVETIFSFRHEEGRLRPGRRAEWLGVRAPTVTVRVERSFSSTSAANPATSRRVSASRNKAHPEP